MMVGKALYEGILLNLSFAPFFIRCLQVRATLATAGCAQVLHAAAMQ